MKKERLRLMAKICHLYFVEGLNQQLIADHYGISRVQVSRMISSAKNEGIVEITIRNPYADESKIEKQILENYKLKEVIIVDNSEVDESMIETLLAQAGVAYLDFVIKNNNIIGVMAGKSISNIAKELNEFQKTNLQFIPLVGGLGSEGADWHSNANAAAFSKKAKGKHWLLHAPAIVRTEEIRNQILEEPDIEKVTTLYKQIDIAIVGIGAISENNSFFRSANLTNEQLREIQSEGAVGSIGTSFFNETGAEVNISFASKMIGISSQSLRNIANVVCIARGTSKVKAIRASLLGGWIDVLITDLITAKGLLERNT